MKPILFSTTMVQAILEGSKTTTRRVMNPQPSSGIRISVFVISGLADGHGRELKPRYLPGDVLWVRETWAKNTDFADKSLVTPDGFIYKATGEYHMGMKWRPSIFMPKEAARIFLRVTDAGYQRLQDINSDGIENEGVNVEGLNTGEEYRYAWKTLWDGINAERGYGWDQNPWVWVYRFVRCEKPIE